MFTCINMSWGSCEFKKRSGFYALQNFNKIEQSWHKVFQFLIEFI